MGAHDPRAGAWHGDFIEKPCRPKFTDFSREFLLSVWFAQEFDVGVETALMDDRVARVARREKYWQIRAQF
jgi:hypothetical protein